VKPDYDVIVIGAGPAGAEAAATAAGFGLSVLCIDEAGAAGGQIYRAPDAGIATVAEPEGEALRARLAGSGADVALAHRVWHVAQVPAADDRPPRFEIAAVGPEGLAQAAAAALIVATGVVERFYPRPGWTLPGVIGLGAATVMLKAQRLLPGKRVVVAGPGPLAPLVANQILRGGGKVVALIDPNPLGKWFAAMPGVARRPGLMAQGSTWMARLVVKGVPAYRGWDVRRIDGADGVESVTVGPVDAKWRPAGTTEKTIAADALCVGYGLTPAAEIYRLLGAEERHDPAQGGWVPVLDAGRRTSIARLYGAGDGAGLVGAAAAPLSGRIAALSAARDLDRLDADAYPRQHEAAQHEFARAAKFGRAMSKLIVPMPGAMERVSDDTILCRCEDVTVGALRAEIAAGAREINALKAATRCGMGPCGGRMCGDAMAATIEAAGVPFAEIGRLTARPPLRPVPLDALTGTFDYADIPLPEKLDT